MSKPYSEDLRTRVIQNYLNGTSKIDIITLFKIGMDTLNRQQFPLSLFRPAFE